MGIFYISSITCETIWTFLVRNFEHQTQFLYAYYVVNRQPLSGSARGGSGIPVYPKKNSQKYPKIPKIHLNIPKIMPRYTLYLKFQESDIPNTRI